MCVAIVISLFLSLFLSLCCSLALWAQNSQSDNSPSNAANRSWTATTESQRQNEDPMRTIESHAQSGNRTFDKQSIERRGSDGLFVPYQEIEKETVQVDPSTVRTITRTFDRNANGVNTLVGVVEEEKRTTAAGDSNIVRTTSTPDVNGSLRLTQRQIEETKKISPNVEETQTTVMLPSVNGGLAPTEKVKERREEGANGTVQSEKTTLLPDGAGKWQVSEIKRTTMTQAGDNNLTSQQVSVPDSEGNMGVVSRTVSNATVIAPEEKHDTVETYSINVPGAVGDGALHLFQRATTNQRTSSTGQQVTQQQVEQSNAGDPSSGLQVTTVTIDTVNPSASGAQATRTVQARDANGSFPVIAVDTTKSDNIHAVQVQIAPGEKPKDAPKKDVKK